MFTAWYSAEVQKQMESAGTSTDEIKVDLRLSVLKALTSHLAGKPLRPVDRQYGKAAHCKRMERSGNIRTCSREDNLISRRSTGKH